MPSLSRSTRVALAAAGAASLVLALPGAADAAGRGHGHAHRHGHSHVHRHKPATHPFTAHGLLVSHTSSTATVLATDLRSGRRTARNKTVTVALPTRRSAAGKALVRRLAAIKPGDRVSFNGTTTGSGDYTVKNLAAAPAPYHAYLGTVTAIDGTLVTVAKAADPSEDQNEPDRGRFTVDTSAATVSVDGAAGTLAVGQTAAFLGSSVHDVVVATSVFAYTVAPDVVAGEVSDLTGTVATVGTGDESSDEGDSTTPTGTAVELAGAALIVDGTSGATPDAVTVGAKVLALGTDNGDGTFTATLAFAFTHACSSREHGDGGQDSGEGD